MYLSLYADGFQKFAFFVLCQCRKDEARVDLADAEAFGHQRTVLVGKVGICGSETVRVWSVNEKQGFGFAQDEVVAFVVFGNQPFESRQVVIKFRPQTFEYGFDERVFQFAGDSRESIQRETDDLSRIAGSVMTVKLTSWRLLAVGARWAASRIRSIASCGTGRSESARFERRALQRSSTCSGEGSPLRSIGWILSGGNELWRTEPVGQTAAQCPQTMQESILRRPIGSPGLA